MILMITIIMAVVFGSLMQNAEYYCRYYESIDPTTTTTTMVVAKSPMK